MDQRLDRKDPGTIAIAAIAVGDRRDFCTTPARGASGRPQTGHGAGAPPLGRAHSAGRCFEQLTKLVAFGDGYVEIEDTKSAGGIAVGVATNEAERQGIDAWKRERLISSGADIIMPDFRQYQILLEYLWGVE